MIYKDYSDLFSTFRKFSLTIPSLLQAITFISKNIGFISLYQNDQISRKLLLQNNSIEIVWSSFIEDLVSQLLIYGNAIVLKDGKILDMTKVRYYKNGWWYMNKSIELDSMLHLSYSFLKQGVWFISPLHASRGLFDIYINIQKYLNNLLGHCGRISGLVSCKNTLGSTQRNNITRDINTFLFTDQTAIKIIEGDEVKWHPTTLSPQQLDIFKIHDIIERKISGIYHIAPVLLGITDTTYTNYEQAMKQFYHNNLVPLLSRIVEELAEFFDIDICIEQNINKKNLLLNINN